MMKNLLYILYERISNFLFEEKFRHFKREPGVLKELYCYAIQFELYYYKTISKLFNLEMVLL
jgi:hypothetical protein